jgi:hypothetical protein
MEISVRDSDEFHRLLLALVDELVDAQIHFNLNQDLAAVMPEYVTVFNQSWTFWSLTLNAHMDAVLLRLCKAYDQYGGDNPSLNLRSFLDTIKANLHLFDEPNFRERLKDSAFVSSLAEDARSPDAAELEKDLESVSNANPLVKTLTIWRNNYFAHRSRTHALDPTAFAREYPLQFPEINALLANGVAIVNRYSHLFNATVHSTGIVGRNDFMSLLKSVRRDLEAQEARIQEQFTAADAAVSKAADT